VRRGKKSHYDLVIIDPLYKIMEGDENSAGDMGAMWNWLDWIGAQLTAAIAVVHHHSKGAQGGKKSMDRASGSGVFARDPDALLDLTELDLTAETRKQIEDAAKARAYTWALEEFAPGWRDRIPEESWTDPVALQFEADTSLSAAQKIRLEERLTQEVTRVSNRTGWRIEATLREFAPFPPIDVWFEYPIHKVDTEGILKDIQPDDGMPKRTQGGKSWRQRLGDAQKAKAQDGTDALIEALDAMTVDGAVHYTEVAEAMGKSESNMRKFLGRRKSDLQKAGYKYEDGYLSQVSQD
jgi:RecA-family ATPase